MAKGIDLERVKTDDVQDFIDNGKWYTYEPGVRVKIRPSTPEAVRAITRKCEKLIRRTGNKRLDEDKQEKLLRYRMVADWEGVLANGKPAECTEENIDLVFDKFVDFAAWIIETANDAGSEIEEAAKGKRENFSPTSDAPASTSSSPTAAKPA
jgi:hypothetical protein